MSNQQDAILSELKFKVEQIIKLYKSSLERVNSLKEKIDKLEGEKELLAGENKRLTGELNAARTANALINSDSIENQQAQKRLNQLVREIDKCIALLNE